MICECDEIEALLQELNSAELHIFPRPRERLAAPDKKGVYVIYSMDERVLHVGSTPRARGGIRQRLQNHMASQSSFAEEYLGGKGSRLRATHKFRCLPVASPRQRALLEALAIGRLCPAHIGHGLE